AVYPADSALWVPLWLAERGVCSWLAVGVRVLRGGVSYRDGRLRVAAHSADWLRDRVKVTGVKARRAGWWRPSSRAPARTRSAGRRRR
ncbi:hypothetical protein ACHL6L_38025, partial [Amycolatopsis sp. A24]